jgi:5-bromo-4-chloroindolyl phosphate hydrolysis protein
MAMADGFRQIAAALLAAAAFLALYLGSDLVWWAAFGLAVATYFALLLIIPRRKPLDEVMLTDRVTAQDIASAAQALTIAGTRLSAAANDAPAADRGDLATMSGHLLSIRDQIKADPNDYRTARRFVDYYMPQIIETVEAYVGLAKLARGDNLARLTELGTQIKGFCPVVAKIDQACIDNDFAALEAQVSALGFQMKRV